MKGPAAALVGLACASAFASPDARGQDAAFGCKVLLCAASPSPGWAGIPYCVPVMQTLFQQLAHGGSWPSCPEANVSNLGFEPYRACPTGLTAMQPAASGRGLEPSDAGNLCGDLSQPQKICSGEDGSDCATNYPTVMREQRSEPDFVDITTTSGVQRFYFSLWGY